MRYNENVNEIATRSADRAMSYARLLLEDGEVVVMNYDGMHYCIRHTSDDRELGLPFPVFVDEFEYENLITAREKEEYEEASALVEKVEERDDIYKNDPHLG